MMTQNGVPDTVEAQMQKLDELGGPLHENHYPVGWAWAGSSPFQWMKRVPSHFGGTRNGMVLSWPKRIKDQGGIRTQFHHVIDIAPTVYSAAGVVPPNEVNGISQIPLAGVDMTYTFSDAQAPGARTTQYFETGGHRAIYKDGWVAASFHGVPWALTGSLGFENNKWELYNIEKDFSQATDLATQQPEKLRDLQAVFDQEAKKFGVYPLDDRFAERGMIPDRPSVVKGRNRFRYSAGTTRIPEGSAPPIYQRGHTITARVVIPQTGAEGVILAEGGSSGGYTLFVQDGKVHYQYNFFGKAIYQVSSAEILSAGEMEIVLDYEQKPFKRFVETTGGPATLRINGKVVGSGMIENAVVGRFSATETLDIGVDLGATVSAAYREKAPFAFTGTIKDVTIELKPPVQP
jgi:arylsulfatase